MQPRHRVRLALILAVALVLTACGGDGDNGRRGAGRASGNPFVIGLVNMEDNPIGSFPEFRQAAESAVRYVNEELGGVDGRPLELKVCRTNGSPESSQACGNQLRAANPVAVIGGLDLGAGAALPILEKAGIAYVGATPALGDELTNPTSFMLSGGTAADLLAHGAYLTDNLKATKVGVVHVDLPGLVSAAVLAARTVLRKKGITDLKVVAEKADAADFTPSLNAANANDPEAIVAVFPPQACSRIMQAKQALGLRAPMLYPGVCASSSALEAAGAGAEGAYFATSFVSYDDQSHPEVSTYREKLRAYGTGDSGPSVISQAGFSTVMNVHRLLSELDEGERTAPALRDSLRVARDHPNFMGHPYSCDGKQVPLLSSVCNPRARIIQYQDGRFRDVVGDWVNGGDLLRLLTG